MESKATTETNEFPDIEIEGWSAQQLAAEAANELPDEILRKMLRGDESLGDPDDRDFAGALQNDELAEENEGGITPETK